MKYIFTLTLSCLMFFGLSAQEVFQKQLGSTGADYMTDMQRLSDGSYIALGYTIVKSADSSYAQLFKLDTAMNVVWQKTFSFNRQMKTTDITPTADGGYLIAGRTWQTPAAAKQGAFVIKTDATGTAAWSRILKFDGSETMLKVMQEADGTLRYFVAGSATTHYIKAAADGTPTSSPIAPTNGAYDLVVNKVVRLAAERYAMLGRFQNTSDCIMVLNKDTIQWTREYNGLLNVPRIFNLGTDAKGDVYFTGDYQAGSYDLRQIIVGKLNYDGTPRWRTVLPLIRNGGRGIDTTWRFTIGNYLQFSGRQVYVSGSMLNEQKGFSVGMISAFDTLSTVGGGNNWKWSRQYGSLTSASDSFARMFVLPNGQLLGAGHTGLGGNVANPNFYFVKTDTAGISSCNYGSYSPVEQVSSAALLAIFQQFVGLAPALTNLTTYNDAIPTVTRATLGATNTICSTTICTDTSVVATVTPLTACRFDTVTVAARGASSYLWSSLAMPTSRTDSTFKVVIPESGTFTFLLTGTPRGGSCFAAKSINVKVNPLPFPPISGTGLVPRFLCQGDSLTVIGGASASTASVFTWSSATNSPWRAGTSRTNIIVKPVTFGAHIYNINIKDENGCVNNGETTIIVRDNVTPTVTFDPIGCPGPDLTLRARGTNEGASPFFDWLLDGQLIGGRRELILPNAIGKKIQVYMTVGTDVCPLAPGTRQVKSPVITVTCQGVSTKDIPEGVQNISVYPNPTEGAFSVKIDLETSKTVGFRVMNMLGQTLQQIAPRTVTAGEMIQEFNLSSAPAGIYLVETRLDNKSVITKVQVQ
ncbi:MAG: T9SS type A sorting domain-containing protein [Saprospiraceae bacterium]|nr:T9SS type A sorting domain-containing protein [Saprospiraceae bacterium]